MWIYYSYVSLQHLEFRIIAHQHCRAGPGRAVQLLFLRQLMIQALTEKKCKKNPPPGQDEYGIINPLCCCLGCACNFSLGLNIFPLLVRRLTVVVVMGVFFTLSSLIRNPSVTVIRSAVARRREIEGGRGGSTEEWRVAAEQTSFVCSSVQWKFVWSLTFSQHVLTAAAAAAAAC